MLSFKIIFRRLQTLGPRAITERSFIMRVIADRLRNLRKSKRLSRKQLADLADIHARTIQRLENEPDQCESTRKETVKRLAKALEVEPGVLTGASDLPDGDKAPAPEPDPVRIGAQIAPKVRLAYDLIKRRYNVNVTDIINMAPLFFTLLAEGSLAWRREKSRQAVDAIDPVEKIEGFWRGGLGTGLYDFVYEGIELEEESIQKADLFGEHLLDDTSRDVDHRFFDSTKENPFAAYLRKLAKEFPDTGIIAVDESTLNFGSDFRYPYFDICNDELDRIANKSEVAKSSLETGYARLSEIPEKLNAVERQKWLEERLPDNLKDSSGKDRKLIRKVVSTHPTDERYRNFLEESSHADHETEEGGDDR